MLNNRRFDHERSSPRTTNHSITMSKHRLEAYMFSCEWNHPRSEEIGSNPTYIDIQHLNNVVTSFACFLMKNHFPACLVGIFQDLTDEKKTRVESVTSVYLPSMHICVCFDDGNRLELYHWCQHLGSLWKPHIRQSPHCDELRMETDGTSPRYSTALNKDNGNKWFESRESIQRGIILRECTYAAVFTSIHVKSMISCLCKCGKWWCLWWDVSFFSEATGDGGVSCLFLNFRKSSRKPIFQ